MQITFHGSKEFNQRLSKAGHKLEISKSEFIRRTLEEKLKEIEEC